MCNKDTMLVENYKENKILPQKRKLESDLNKKKKKSKRIRCTICSKKLRFSNSFNCKCNYHIIIKCYSM